MEKVLELPIVGRKVVASKLASLAVKALIDEVRLTPKPGLVDALNNGSHRDLTLSLMETSALALHLTFYRIVVASWNKLPSQELREDLAEIGRQGEREMLEATGQVNTHKGAIWSLGLICAAVSCLISSRNTLEINLEDILGTVGQIASYKDRFDQRTDTNGQKMRDLYQLRSAREEASAGYPTIRYVAFATLRKFQKCNIDLKWINVLLALISVVDDTCILSRSNMSILLETKRRANEIMTSGGLDNSLNWDRYTRLGEFMTANWISPGGSADLLASTMFLEYILNSDKTYNYGIFHI